MEPPNRAGAGSHGDGQTSVGSGPAAAASGLAEGETGRGTDGAGQVLAALLARGPQHFAEECARVAYDPESPSYAEPVTQSETRLEQAEVRQWHYLVEAAEQLLRLASLLIDPRDVDGATIEGLRDLLTVPAYESETSRIDREQSLRSARQNVELALALQAEIDDLRRTDRAWLAAEPAVEPAVVGVRIRHATAEGRIHELLAVDGAQTSAEIARKLGGLTPQRVAQICSHSGRIEKRRRAARRAGTLWGVRRTNGKPNARRKPR